jgi:hypothetical protein
MVKIMSKTNFFSKKLDELNDNEELVNQYRRSIAGDVDLSCRIFLSKVDENQVMNLLEEAKEGLSGVNSLSEISVISEPNSLLEVILKEAKSVEERAESEHPNLLKHQTIEQFVLDVFKNSFSVFSERTKAEVEQNKKQKVGERLDQQESSLNSSSSPKEQEKFKEVCELSSEEFEQFFSSMPPTLTSKIVTNVASKSQPSQKIKDAHGKKVSHEKAVETGII